jgi:hypothetical protein
MYDGHPPAPPKVFVCCKPCRERRCGVPCNHNVLDGMKSSPSLATDPTTHKGCTCIWAEKVSGGGPDPRLVTG